MCCCVAKLSPCNYRKYKYNEHNDIPNSSRRTKELGEACCRMAEVSLSSTKKVLSPANRTHLDCSKNSTNSTNLNGC